MESAVTLLREPIDLKQLYKQELDKIDPYFADYPWEDKRYYAMWCGQMYYFIRNATRLLAAAAAKELALAGFVIEDSDTEDSAEDGEEGA